VVITNTTNGVLSHNKCYVGSAGGVPSSTGGFSGDGGSASSATFNNPWGVALDKSGNLYIADMSNNRIRRVDAVAKTIKTVAGGAGSTLNDGVTATSAMLNFPRGIAFDTSGNMYIADSSNHRIRKIASFCLGCTNVIQTVVGTGTAGYNGDLIAGTSATLN
jgi:DNA-binding beta-propeller fold protein YncE